MKNTTDPQSPVGIVKRLRAPDWNAAAAAGRCSPTGLDRNLLLSRPDPQCVWTSRSVPLMSQKKFLTLKTLRQMTRTKVTSAGEEDHSTPSSPNSHPRLRLAEFRLRSRRRSQVRDEDRRTDVSLTHT